MTDLQDLVTSLGAVYYQDPQVPEGYVLSGSAVTHVVNLIDDVQIQETGTNSIEIGTICSQDAFTYNPEGTNSTTRITRSPYNAVVSCLQTDFTFFGVCDQFFDTLIFGRANVVTNAPNVGFRVTAGSNPSNLGFQVTKRKTSAGSAETHTVTGISLTHHVYELLCTNANWEMLVDGVTIGSGAWANAGTGFGNPIVNFFGGSDGVDSTALTRSQGQMVLFPSILGASDRQQVREAMARIMCNGHATAAPNPIFFGGF